MTMPILITTCQKSMAVTPTARMPLIDICRTTLMRFRVVRKLGLNRDRAAPMITSASPFSVSGSTAEIALREGENLLGRLDEGVAWFESPTVSRRHARIVVEGGKAILEDLGSKNGTFLGGERISSPRPLADGDEILLGQVHATFRVLPPVSTRTGVGR